MRSMLALAALASACAEHAGGPGPATPSAAEICARQACRPARTIVLQSRTRQMIVNAEAMPYVDQDSIFVRAGDDFFVAADEKNGELVNLRKVDGPRPDAPNVLHFTFKQEQIGTGDFIMMLMIEEKFAHPFVYRAIGALPNGRMFATSTCPIHPGIVSTEMWKDPVWLLALDHFRASDDADHVCKKQK